MFSLKLQNSSSFRNILNNKLLHYVLLCVVFLGYRYLEILILTDELSELEFHYSQASLRVIHSYDDQRRNNMFHGLKISTNTYNDDVLSEPYGSLGAPENKENATILMLVRNRELPGALISMRSVEDRFNRDYNYDWIFLNDVPFDNEFIEATTLMASGNTKYALIPSNYWNRPNSINETFFEERLQVMENNGVIYGGSKSYRNMCRFNSGFFFRQTILDDYDYYLRVEPDVEYLCDLPYDPFEIMRKKKKKYGFVMSLLEYEETIPTLWDSVTEYISKDDGKNIDMNNNIFDFLIDKSPIKMSRSESSSNSSYNRCHFWSNFEVGDLNFFRSDRYLEFFNHLDSEGGFYYERWGDAPVHTIAASLLLNRDEVIHFDEIGYRHAPYYTYPSARYLQLKQKCICDYDPNNEIEVTGLSCLPQWWKNGSGKRFMKEL